MSGFDSLKRNRNNDLAKLTKEVEKISGNGGNNKDERVWTISVDAAGNGSAVIRFLPAPENEEIPWVRIFTHGFKGPKGAWYIENSRTNLQGEEDPVAKFNSELWEGTTDDNDPRRKQARAQKRQLNYWANILVITDKANPDNEGKVFLYRFGKKLFDKIMDKMNPPEDDLTPINPFDFWEGANFRLRARLVDKQRNYDTSQFDAPTELFDGDDAKLEELYGKLHSLKAMIAPDKFKSYDELEKILHRVLDTKGTGVAKQEKKSIVPDDEDEVLQEKKEPVKKTKAEPKPAADDDDDDATDMSYFQKLAQDDDEIPF